MRTVVLTLLIFCAVISGWASAMAQVQDLGHRSAPSATQSMQHSNHGAAHTADATASQETAGTLPAKCNDKSCRHHHRAVHPVNCAACFAIDPDILAFERVAINGGTVEPAPAAALTETLRKPRFPPPRSMMSLSL